MISDIVILKLVAFRAPRLPDSQGPDPWDRDDLKETGG